MDTIAYLPDPYDPSKMLNTIEEQARFTDIALAITLQAPLHKRFDLQDLDNDAAGTKCLNNSLEPELRAELRRKVDPTDSFAIVWLKLVHLLVTRSIMRFERIKTTIRSLHPQQYPG